MNILLLGTGLAALAAFPAFAQAPQWQSKYSAEVVGGVSQFDLSGTGTATIFGAQATARLNRAVLLQGGLRTFRPEEGVGKNRYYIPEAQLQFQIPASTVRPFIGLGGGYFVGTEGRPTRGTASAAGGLRVVLPDYPLDVSGELRVRGIGSNFGGATAEWTLGLGYRF